MNGVLMLVLGVALSVGVFSLLFIRDTIEGAVKFVLIPLIVASAAATSPGDSAITNGILSGAFLVLVGAQALNSPDEKGVPETAVIFVSLMFILGTLGQSAMVAQLCAFVVLAVTLFGSPRLHGPLCEVLTAHKDFSYDFLKFWG